MSWLSSTFKWLSKMLTSVESRWMVYSSSLCFSLGLSVCLKMFTIKFKRSKIRPPALWLIISHRRKPSLTALVCSLITSAPHMLDSSALWHGTAGGLMGRVLSGPDVHTPFSLPEGSFTTHLPGWLLLTLKGLSPIPPPSGSPTWYF